MIKRAVRIFGFTLIHLGWCVCRRIDGSLFSNCISLTRKHITYSIEIDRGWEKKQRKAKLEQKIKKHEEKIKRLQYEIDFRLR